MNLYSHGVDPQLDFSNLPEIREKYETFTRMKVGERQPYAGDLVFSCFFRLPASEYSFIFNKLPYDEVSSSFVNISL